MSTERPDNDAAPDATDPADATPSAEDAESGVGAERAEGAASTEGANSAESAAESAASAEHAESAGSAAESAASAEHAESAGSAASTADSAASAEHAESATGSAASTEGAAGSDESAEPVAGAERAAGTDDAASPQGPEKSSPPEAAPHPDTDVSTRTVGGAEERKAGRGRSSVLVASVAAAVLLVGGGGAYLATSATSDSGGSDSGAPAADGTPPPLALDGSTEGGTNGIAPGEPDPNGVTYRAGGDLPDGPDSAPVYRSAGEVTSAEVARLAKALGVEGTPAMQGGTWKVGGTKDGSGPSLQVNKDAPGTWTFSRYTPGADNCRKADVCASGSAAGGDPASEAVAKKAAAPVLKALGQDAAKLDATQVSGAVRTVNADPEIGGLPTYGWTTGIQVGADGRVAGGSGNVKAPDKGDTYPVTGADKALDLMNGTGQGQGTGDGRKGPGGCPSPVPLKDKDEAPCGSSTAAPASRSVAVEDAVFGLAARFSEGKSVLVPSWLFQVRPEGAGASFTVTQPAVDPAYLTTPEPPSVNPSPGEPSGSAPKKRDVKVEGYTAQGKELTVSFWGGVCDEYSASADEKNGEVTVTVTDKPSDEVCIMIAKAMERTVQLDKPLGDREVVGTNGKEVPKGSLADRVPSAQ
ncbi:hypothetical protein [Streptomyces sp. NPDC046862]|uniref:hypothetical protein n=1 Tax=Streptomyces sp. NPDC046862 TaxID=3154603 RepID=UPI003455CA19